MDEVERQARQQFALNECERAAQEAAQCRAELGPSISERLMAMPAPDAMERWRADADKRAEVGRRATEERRAAEQREIKQARAQNLSAIESRIKAEIAEMVEERIAEEIVKVL